MRVLITGGSGFIGRNLAKELKQLGHFVVTLDLREQPLRSDLHFQKSVLDFQSVLQAAKGTDVVFHLAATTSPPQFDSLSSDGFETNVMGTYNVLRAAVESGTRRAVVASSSAVYGNILSKVNETDAPGELPNLYGVSKFTDELVARSLSLSNAIDTVCLRYFNTYGSGENSKGAYSSPISKFANDISCGKTPTIFDDGKQSRDFIYVKDTVRATILSMENGISGESYNVGSGVTTDFNTIYDMVKEEMHSEIGVAHIKNPFKSYQRFTQADITKIGKIGFEPKFDLRSGIRDMVKLELTPPESTDN